MMKVIPEKTLCALNLMLRYYNSITIQMNSRKKKNTTQLTSNLL
jgi:hypothetical protein